MSNYSIRQLLDKLQPPESGKKSIVVSDDDNTKIVLFAFAAGAGLAEHVARLPAIIQIIQGEAQLTIANDQVDGKPGTWIPMEPRTPHSIAATRPVVMLLTMVKNHDSQG